MEYWSIYVVEPNLKDGQNVYIVSPQGLTQQSIPTLTTLAGISKAAIAGFGNGMEGNGLDITITFVPTAQGEANGSLSLSMFANFLAYVEFEDGVLK